MLTWMPPVSQDFALVYSYTEQAKFVTLRPRELPQYLNVLYPFQSGLWLMLGCAIIATTACFGLLAYADLPKQRFNRVSANTNISLDLSIVVVVPYFFTRCNWTFFLWPMECYLLRTTSKFSTNLVESLGKAATSDWCGCGLQHL